MLSVSGIKKNGKKKRKKKKKRWPLREELQLMYQICAITYPSFPYALRTRRF